MKILIKPAPAAIRVMWRSLLHLLLIIIAALPASSQVRRFTILNTTDEHSTLVPLPMVDYYPGQVNPAIGGYARLSTLVNEIRRDKNEEPVLLFSSGDIMGGTPFAWLILEGYSAEIELMKLIGYDAMTIGNHEFDYGPDLLADYFSRAGYPLYGEKLPVIASNLSIPEGHGLNKTGIKENHIFELDNGLMVGVFGLLGNSAYSVASFAEPVGVSDQHSAAERQVRLLRGAGADIVIAITHAGIEEDRRLAADVDGIDVILGGHDHHLSFEPEIINNTIVFHSGYYLRYLGKLEFEWDDASFELSLVNKNNNSPFLIPLDHTIDEDPVIKALAYEFIEDLNEFVSFHTGHVFTDVTEAVAFSDFEMIRPEPFVETAPGNFVTDAMRLMAEKITGKRVDVAFQGNGIIRADIVPGTMELSEGKVSFFDLVTVSGLGSGPDGKAGYPLVSIYLTEQEILNILEISSLLSQMMGDIYFLQVSGLRYSYDPGKAVWLKIPFTGIPVPAYRSVRTAELFTGEGIQDDEEFISIDGSGERLYHVVTDYYLTSFLPMVGEILPRLKLVLKDESGNPAELDDTVIFRGEQEFKVWEALAMYAASFGTGQSGIPVIPEYYANTAGRINMLEGIPLKVWSHILLILLLSLIVFLVVRLFKTIRRRMGR
jgi:5'-nucleotidase / UDP-sugar diphosphatase